MQEEITAEPAGEKTTEIVADLIERLRRGEKMVDIFGLDSKTMTSLEGQAFRLYRHGLFSRAQVAGRGVLALDEDRVLTRLIMGDMALEEYRFADAVQHLDRAHQLAPDKPIIQARLGEALLKGGEPKRASKMLAMVLASDHATADDIQRCRALLETIAS